jgi:hypothetical protein
LLRQEAKQKSFKRIKQIIEPIKASTIVLLYWRV